MTKHDWREVTRYDNCQGFLCNKCELFIKYHSTRPVDGCVEEYDEVIPCSGGCIVSIKYHKALPIEGCGGDYSTMSQQDIRRELSGTEFWNEDKGDRN